MARRKLGVAILIFTVLALACDVFMYSQIRKFYKVVEEEAQEQQIAGIYDAITNQINKAANNDQGDISRKKRETITAIDFFI